MNCLDAFAEVAQIGTALIGVGWTAFLVCRADLKHSGKQHTIIHLMARLKMSEAEILHAAFKSARIDCPVLESKRGMATEILFEYR